MKLAQDYIVYATDTDGSERKAATLSAKSAGHARAIAARLGVRKITEIVAVAEVKTSKELMDEIRRQRYEFRERQAAIHAYDGQFA